MTRSIVFLGPVTFAALETLVGLAALVFTLALVVQAAWGRFFRAG